MEAVGGNGDVIRCAEGNLLLEGRGEEGKRGGEVEVVEMGGGRGGVVVSGKIM